uniref:Uncharacterized protein n=1 Tax=Manihot esculenta TaxID=3983 RepID=A0A2C9VUN9_MANES
MNSGKFDLLGYSDVKMYVLVYSCFEFGEQYGVFLFSFYFRALN